MENTPEERLLDESSHNRDPYSDLHESLTRAQGGQPRIGQLWSKLRAPQHVPADGRHPQDRGNSPRCYNRHVGSTEADRLETEDPPSPKRQDGSDHTGENGRNQRPAPGGDQQIDDRLKDDCVTDKRRDCGNECHGEKERGVPIPFWTFSAATWFPRHQLIPEVCATRS